MIHFAGISSHEELINELDRLLAEPPTEASDIAGELAAIVAECRDRRETERPKGDRS